MFSGQSRLGGAWSKFTGGSRASSGSATAFLDSSDSTLPTLLTKLLNLNVEEKRLVLRKQAGKDALFIEDPKNKSASDTDHKALKNLLGLLKNREADEFILPILKAILNNELLCQSLKSKKELSDSFSSLLMSATLHYPEPAFHFMQNPEVGDSLGSDLDAYHQLFMKKQEETLKAKVNEDSTSIKDVNTPFIQRAQHYPDLYKKQLQALSQGPLKACLDSKDLSGLYSRLLYYVMLTEKAHLEDDRIAQHLLSELHPLQLEELAKRFTLFKPLVARYRDLQGYLEQKQAISAEHANPLGGPEGAARVAGNATAFAEHANTLPSKLKSQLRVQANYLALKSQNNKDPFFELEQKQPIDNKAFVETKSKVVSFFKDVINPTLEVYQLTPINYEPLTWLDLAPIAGTDPKKVLFELCENKICPEANEKDSFIAFITCQSEYNPKDVLKLIDQGHPLAEEIKDTFLTIQDKILEKEAQKLAEELQTVHRYLYTQIKPEAFESFEALQEDEHYQWLLERQDQIAYSIKTDCLNAKNFFDYQRKIALYIKTLDTLLNQTQDETAFDGIQDGLNDLVFENNASTHPLFDTFRARLTDLPGTRDERKEQGEQSHEVPSLRTLDSTFLNNCEGKDNLLSDLERKKAAGAIDEAFYETTKNKTLEDYKEVTRSLLGQLKGTRDRYESDYASLQNIQDRCLELPNSSFEQTVKQTEAFVELLRKFPLPGAKLSRAQEITLSLLQDIKRNNHTSDFFDFLAQASTCPYSKKYFDDHEAYQCFQENPDREWFWVENHHRYPSRQEFLKNYLDPGLEEDCLDGHLSREEAQKAFESHQSLEKEEKRKSRELRDSLVRNAAGHFVFPGESEDLLGDLSEGILAKELTERLSPSKAIHSSLPSNPHSSLSSNLSVASSSTPRPRSFTPLRKKKKAKEKKAEKSEAVDNFVKTILANGSSRVPTVIKTTKRDFRDQFNRRPPSEEITDIFVKKTSGSGIRPLPLLETNQNTYYLLKSALLNDGYIIDQDLGQAQWHFLNNGDRVVGDPKLIQTARSTHYVKAKTANEVASFCIANQQSRDRHSQQSPPPLSASSFTPVATSSFNSSQETPDRVDLAAQNFLSIDTSRIHGGTEKHAAKTALALQVTKGFSEKELESFMGKAGINPDGEMGKAIVAVRKISASQVVKTGRPNPQELSVPEKKLSPCQLEELQDLDGSKGFAFKLSAEDQEKASLLIATNLGCPMGEVGKIICRDGKLSNADIEHLKNSKTQEEPTVCCMDHVPQVFEALSKTFGLGTPEQITKSTTTRTVQLIDYTEKSPDKNAVAKRYYLCTKLEGVSIRDGSNSYTGQIAYIGSPNAGCTGRNQYSTMTRTFDPNAAKDYSVFREGLKHAFRAYFDTMIESGKVIAIAAKAGCGIYAGPHKSRIRGEISTLINEVLDEEVGKGEQAAARRCFFEKIVLVDKYFTTNP